MEDPSGNFSGELRKNWKGSWVKEKSPPCKGKLKKEEVLGAKERLQGRRPAQASLVLLFLHCQQRPSKPSGKACNLSSVYSGGLTAPPYGFLSELRKEKKNLSFALVI